MSEFTEFINKQDGIYNNFRTASSEMGQSRGIEQDPGVEPQGAFLIAWRYPEKTGLLVEEFSLQIADAVDAVTYGAHNAHTTVSDHDLQTGPEVHDDQTEILDILSKAVKLSLEKNGSGVISAVGVEFKDNFTNGKTVIAAGIPTQEIWQVNQEVLRQSTELGIPLKGTWGSHMTVSRFKRGQPAESQPVADLMRIIADTPAIGPSTPEAIDVGYFHTSPDNGFVSTAHQRFELGPKNY